jgi:uncharacterized membrane protein YqaE (UPF0057 family)
VFIAENSCSSAVLINILLTILGWIPGVLCSDARLTAWWLCVLSLSQDKVPAEPASKHHLLNAVPSSPAGIIHAIYILFKR